MNAVLHSLAYSLDFLRDQVAGLSPNDMVTQPAGVVNHPAWTIGHLTHTCEMLGGAIGVEPWLPGDWGERFGTDRALGMLLDARGRVVEAVQRMDEASLDAPFPDAAYLDVFPTIRHALTQVLVGHMAFHVGQVSVWRRAMGLPPMTRPYE
mgnify:CR=1 FL=1